MNRGLKSVSTWFGISAGLAGIGHGVFEMLQGNTATPGLLILSMGPPCVPEEAWNACEPAMTVLPNFFVSGVFSVLLGVAMMVWSIWFVQRKSGGVVQLLLSAALLLFGGGFFPPLIGIVAGIAGIKINKPLAGKRMTATRKLLAGIWPWPLVLFLVWIWGQIPVGSLCNDFMQSIMGFGVILVLSLLPLSVFSAYAKDIQRIA